jgi:hypothetical protein
MVAPRWVEPHDDRDVVFSSAWRAKCKAFEAEQKPLVPVFAHAIASRYSEIHVRMPIEYREDPRRTRVGNGDARSEQMRLS